MCIRFRRNVRNIARLTFNAVRKNRDFENLVSLRVTRLKMGFLLLFVTEGGVMTKIHSPAGLSFLSTVKIGAPPSEKVSWSLW